MESQRNRNWDTHANPYRGANTYSYSYCYSLCNSHGYRYGNSYRYPNSYRYGHRRPHPNGYGYSYGHTYGHGHRLPFAFKSRFTNASPAKHTDAHSRVTNTDAYSHTTRSNPNTNSYPPSFAYANRHLPPFCDAYPNSEASPATKHSYPAARRDG